MPGRLRGALHYLTTATSWALTAGAAVLVVGGVALVSRWPDALWPLHGAALGLIVGAAAVAVDERCALLVDVGPRPLWWRTALRAVGPAALVVAWVAAHLVLRHRLPDHLGVLALQGLVAATVGFGVATAGRATGRAEPGTVLAATAVPLVAGAALARPFEAGLPLFPVWPHEDWGRATVLWAALGAGSLLVLGLALWVDARPSMRRATSGHRRAAPRDRSGDR